MSINKCRRGTERWIGRFVGGKPDDCEPCTRLRAAGSTNKTLQECASPAPFFDRHLPNERLVDLSPSFRRVSVSQKSQISRSSLYLIDLTDTDKNIDALEGTRDVVDQSALDPEPFGFSGVRTWFSLPRLCVCMRAFDCTHYLAEQAGTGRGPHAKRCALQPEPV